MQTIIIIILIIIYFINTFKLIRLRTEIKGLEKSLTMYRLLFRNNYDKNKTK